MSPSPAVSLTSPPLREDLVEEGAEVALDQMVDPVAVEALARLRVARDVDEEHGDVHLPLGRARVPPALPR